MRVGRQWAEIFTEGNEGNKGQNLIWEPLRYLRLLLVVLTL
jgi:hypothetical protein